MAIMVRIPVSLPKPLKDKLDELRDRGYTASGYIRYLLERELENKGGKAHGRP